MGFTEGNVDCGGHSAPSRARLREGVADTGVRERVWGGEGLRHPVGTMPRAVRLILLHLRGDVHPQLCLSSVTLLETQL